MAVRLSEQRKGGVRVGICDLQRLDCQLLLGLQSLQTGRLLVHVCIDKASDALVDGCHQHRREFRLHADAGLSERIVVEIDQYAALSAAVWTVSPELTMPCTAVRLFPMERSVWSAEIAPEFV